MKRMLLYITLLVTVVLIRMLICEAYVVSTCSMEPAIQPTEVLLVSKWEYGALLPRRLADIPVVNIFTWISTLRKADLRQYWGIHRFPGYRNPQKGDVILFRSMEKEGQVLVKRIDHVIRNSEGELYYVLGDNREHSADSRQFGPVPQECLIGRATRILWSWDNKNRKPRISRLYHKI